MAVITWTVKAEIANGPSFTKAATLNVEAYERIDVVVAGGASDLEVTVDGTGMQFLAIRVDQPSPIPTPSDLSYKINDATATAITLDQPVQLLVGEGAIGFLGATPLEKLFFKNDSADNATISILVGRDATP
jgi:hypothetical protein